MPTQHQVTIKYHDGHGHAWDETSTLDVELMAGVMFTDVLGVHHAAQALREIRDLLRRYSNLSGPVETIVERREDYEARARRTESERQAAYEAPKEKVLPQRDAGTSGAERTDTDE